MWSYLPWCQSAHPMAGQLRANSFTSQKDNYFPLKALFYTHSTAFQLPFLHHSVLQHPSPIFPYSNLKKKKSKPQNQLLLGRVQRQNNQMPLVKDQRKQKQIPQPHRSMDLLYTKQRINQSPMHINEVKSGLQTREGNGLGLEALYKDRPSSIFPPTLQIPVSPSKKGDLYRN